MGSKVKLSIFQIVFAAIAAFAISSLTHMPYTLLFVGMLGSSLLLNANRWDEDLASGQASKNPVDETVS
jgi:uncharacterized membrane-anchored protein YitT (DUF2179 family)